MSHFTTIKAKIYDKGTLIDVLREMGYKILDNNILHGYNGEKFNVAFQIELDSYNIGFRKVNDCYEIVADWYGVRGVNPKDFTRDLTQRYALKTITDELQRGRLRRYRIVSKQTDENNTIKLVLRGS